MRQLEHQIAPPTPPIQPPPPSPVVRPSSAAASEPPLGGKEYDVLDTLFDSKAFAPDVRLTTEEVAGKLLVDAPSLKEAASSLVKRGLCHSKKGRGGGLWLSAAGKELVETQRKR